MEKFSVGIFTEVYHPTMNGVVVSIDTFKKELATLGVRTIVFAPDSPRAIRETDVIRVPSLPFHRDYPPPLPFFSSEYNRLELLGLSLIHTQHPFVMGWYGLHAARRLGVPVVTTYHTLIVEYARTNGRLLPFGANVMEWLSRRYCNAVDLVITPSPSMKRVLQKYGITAPIEVNPTGIYPEQFRTPLKNLRQTFRLPKDRRILLYVGRLSDEKNIKMLLAAFRLVVHETDRVHLLLVGSGPKEEEYRAIARRSGVADHVTFAGFQGKEVTNGIFGAVDCFVFPSTTDTQGIVIMEAMAAGTPIVAVDALGPGDILTDGETGMVTGNNASEFALAILKVLGEPKLAGKLSAQGKKEAGKYAAAVTAKRQRTLYQSLLKHSGNLL
jgi:1,2-diacylglycerol 3-alpha-glucosyltransferase